MNHSQKIIHMVFVTDNQPSEVLKPGKQALYLPSAPIAPEFSPILSIRFFSSFTMWRNHFNTTFVKQLFIKFVAIVSFITNQLVRCISSKAAVYRIFDKLYLMGRSAFNVSGDRKTSSVCNCHDLGAFAAFCLADSKTAFFEMASINEFHQPRSSSFGRSAAYLGLVPQNRLI